MLNLTGALTLRAGALGEDTLLRQIARLVEAAERSRSRYATLAERAARAYAPIVILLATTALLWWGLTTGDWRRATTIAAAVLIVTCPCGLGLAVPAVLTAASGRLFRDGVLLKDGTALERLAEIDTVVLDKTGTLTTGRPVLTNAAAIPPAAFAVAAALAAGSAHPLSRAIREAAERSGLRPAPVEDIAEEPGAGTEGRLRGACVRLGRGTWVGAPGPDPVTTCLAPDRRRGAGRLHLRRRGPTRRRRRGRGACAPPDCRCSSSPATPRRRSPPSPAGSASTTGAPAPRRRRRSRRSTPSAPRGDGR